MLWRIKGKSKAIKILRKDMEGYSYIHSGGKAFLKNKIKPTTILKKTDKYDYMTIKQY